MNQTAAGRSVIRIGNLYVVSLPISWVRRNGIRKKDRLIVEELSNGSLRIVPLKNNRSGAGIPNASPNEVAAPRSNRDGPS